MTSEVRMIILPQDRETPLTYEESGDIYFRFSQLRSHNSIALNIPGEDFLAIKENGQRFVFALCDGVANSFNGRASAYFLGKKLLEYFWEQNFPESEENLRNALIEKLNSWALEANALVNTLEIAMRVIK